MILGVLATVTVFAVRGITAKSQENSEAADLGTLETAVDAYWMNNKTNPTEADLVTAGFLTEESTLHNLAVAGDGSYSVTNVRTGQVVGTGEAGAPSFEAELPLISPKEAKSAGVGTRTQVGVGDYDGDGDLDLLVGDNANDKVGKDYVRRGNVWLYRNSSTTAAVEASAKRQRD